MIAVTFHFRNCSQFVTSALGAEMIVFQNDAAVGSNKLSLLRPDSELRIHPATRTGSIDSVWLWLSSSDSFLIR